MTQLESSNNPARAERNRRLVIDGFARFAAGDIAVLAELLADDFVEHSPGNPSGKDAFIEFISQAPVAGAALELKRAVADDQHVVLHYLMRTAGGDQAVVDIWRLETNGSSSTGMSSSRCPNRPRHPTACSESSSPVETEDPRPAHT